MAVTITTITGFTTGTGRCHQYRYAEAANGVRWVCVMRAGSTRLEFWWSNTAGASWSEDSSQRIGSINTDSHASFVIARMPDGDERLFATYEKSNRIRLAVGHFDGSSKTSFHWHDDDIKVGTTGGDEWRYPTVAVTPLSNRWHAHVLWGHLRPGNVHPHLARVVAYSGGGYYHAGEETFNERNVSVYPAPTIAHRHAGDRVTIDTSQPDFYMGWSQGTAGDNLPRIYQQRVAGDGRGWRRQNQRTRREESEWSGLITSCFNGHQFCTLTVPQGSNDTMVLYLMTPDDSARTEVAVPALGQGPLTNIGMTWDERKGDLWLAAAGNSNNRPHVVKYDWATRTFGSWAEVNTDTLADDTLTLKPGSGSQRIEGVYTTTAANGVVRHELFAVTNNPPTVSWVTESGAKNVAQALTLQWAYSDPDGDVQADYQLRRSINGAAHEYYNGSSWVASSSTTVVSATDTVVLASPWASDGDEVLYEVRVSDGTVQSAWSNSLEVLASTLVDPTITSPSNGAVITQPQVTLQWTVSEQSAYRPLLLDSSGTLVLQTPGWQNDSVPRTHTFTDLVDGTSYQLGIETKNADGLTSTRVSIDISTDFTPPATPLVEVLPHPVEGAMVVRITNPTPGVGEDDTEHNHLWRRLDMGTWLRIAINLEPNTTYVDYRVGSGQLAEYAVEAASPVGATAFSQAVA